jgi:muramoyltetrapeptide carboxypeptidase LdcA involved in peptidoglycan recycling
MIYPNFLKDNNTIGVPAPSNGTNNVLKQNRINNSIKLFNSYNNHVILSNNAFKSRKGRSANNKKRADEFNNMVKDKNIDLLICLSGGDFLVEILDYIDFELIKKNPKFVCGFSDPTGLLYPITTKYDIATIYGNNFSSLGCDPIDKTQIDFLKIIKGDLIKQHSCKLYEAEPKERITGLEPFNLTEKVCWKTLDNKDVNIKGRIIGGCFDIIAELSGTKYDGINEFNEKYKDDGIIWYFDNCELSLDETIRILWKMNELDYFKYTKCIIFGRFGNTNSYYEYDVRTCLRDSAVGKLKIPVIYDADFSHKAPCLTVINGAIANLKVKNGKGELFYELK